MPTPTPTAAVKPAQHTPGPWAYSEASSTGIATVAWVAHFAVGPDFGSPDMACYDHHGHAEADARLIAAAPELLAACQRLAESAAYWSEYDVPLGIVDDLQAAIAKATGVAA